MPFSSSQITSIVVSLSRNGDLKRFSGILERLREIHETKLILEQNYIFFLVFQRSDTQFFAHLFKNCNPLEKRIIIFHQGVLDSLHNQEHIIWNYV